MALWTYHDFDEQTSDALRLTRLRLHISEVRAAISANIQAGGGKGRQSDPLVEVLKGLNERRQELETSLGLNNKGAAIALADMRG